MDIAALKYMWRNNINRGWLDDILPRIEDGPSIAPAPHPDDL
jgi:hypothetical protein